MNQPAVLSKGLFSEKDSTLSYKYLSLGYSFFFFPNYLAALWHVDLSSLTRMKPMPAALEARSLNHWTTGKS